MDHRHRRLAGLRLSLHHRLRHDHLDARLRRRPGNFAHCIAASGEILTAVFTGQTPLSTYWGWLFPAVAGNICGGVGMVTLLEYGQVIYGGDAEAEALPPAPVASRRR